MGPLECFIKFVFDVKLPGSWDIVSILYVTICMKEDKLLLEEGQVVPVAYDVESMVP